MSLKEAIKYSLLSIQCQISNIIHKMGQTRLNWEGKDEIDDDDDDTITSHMTVTW